MTTRSPVLDHPLRFAPVLKDYIWGGRRLAAWGKPLGPGQHWAESWEVVDHPQGQSHVLAGPFQGRTLHELVVERGEELLGRDAPRPRFPLLLKLLDAHDRLSVQVHPNDQQAARLDPPDEGKTEAWIVLEAAPGSGVWAGLLPGVDRPRLEEHLRQGTVEQCLHFQEVRPGDCILLPAGTVHAIGPGLLLAEIQQASNVTFRLFDWNRLGPDGRPRPLHVEQALEVIDFSRGPISPSRPQPTATPGEELLVACEKFVVRRRQVAEPVRLGGQQQCHIVLVIQGSGSWASDPLERPMRRGDSALLPAAAGAVEFVPREPTTLLHFHLPPPGV